MANPSFGLWVHRCDQRLIDLIRRRSFYRRRRLRRFKLVADKYKNLKEAFAALLEKVGSK